MQSVFPSKLYEIKGCPLCAVCSPRRIFVIFIVGICIDDAVSIAAGQYSQKIAVSSASSWSMYLAPWTEEFGDFDELVLQEQEYGAKHRLDWRSVGESGQLAF
jgi:hypothetical protein